MQNGCIISNASFQLTAVPILKALRFQYTGANDNNDSDQISMMIENLNELEAAEFWTAMSQIHQQSAADLRARFLNALQPSATYHHDDSTSSQTSSKFKERVKRTTAKVTGASRQLKAALVKVCSELNSSITETVSDKELCHFVNDVVEKDVSQQFWNRVTTFFPEKSKKQLYDFYRNSFQKAIYDADMSVDDKLLLEALNLQKPALKPAILAQEFIEKTGKSLLKHNVVMQVVNLRRAQQHQRSTSKIKLIAGETAGLE
ncbi:Hypothetical_protein [Hexamita inflata]|uniref:Hypothetical_protein n=1 Tax=Hexamita inflata TaxID=28002 RepID=A0AA86QUZ7_9EUKA|nr:Hypothetical protein HINF_LOCUS54171 [Hexamita inflata]